MRTIACTLLVFGILACAGVRPASAQSRMAALVNVPFDFIVSTRVLPAGTYRISADFHDPTLLTVASVRDAEVTAYAATNWATSPYRDDGRVRVAFKNVQGHMFLWQVGMPGQNEREIAMTSRDAVRTLAKLNLLPANVGVNDVK